MDNLQASLERIEQWSGGTLGVSAIHLPSLVSIDYHADRQFLLCSTYKIPIAICLLKKIERGEFSLNDQIHIHEYDLRASLMSSLNQLNYAAPVQMSILNLLQFMLQESCNSSTDILLKLIGGPSVVMQCLKDLGIDGLRVDRSTLQLMSALEGVTLAQDHYTIQEYKALVATVSPEAAKEARMRFKTDQQDHGTPKAMTALLEKIQTHQILTPEDSEMLLKIMRRCKIGPKRLMGLLPPGTSVSHKTGTATGYTNDVGIIDLPNHQGSIAISVFVKDTGKSCEADERVIAEVARIVFDYFLFHGKLA